MCCPTIRILICTKACKWKWSEVHCKEFTGFSCAKKSVIDLVLGVRLIQQAAAVEIDIGDIAPSSVRD